jgi:hypothetical protein
MQINTYNKHKHLLSICMACKLCRASGDSTTPEPDFAFPKVAPHLLDFQPMLQVSPFFDHVHGLFGRNRTESIHRRHSLDPDAVISIGVRAFEQESMSTSIFLGYFHKKKLKQNTVQSKIDETKKKTLGTPDVGGASAREGLKKEAQA